MSCYEYERGERGVWRVVRVPDRSWEDLRQLHREREDLLADRTHHRNRLSSKLVAQGVRLPIGKGFVARLKAGLIREWERLQGVQAQLRALERELGVLIESTGRTQAVRSLMMLTGVGWVGAWVLVMELFGWRELANRRQLASLAGLVPTPYSSGHLARDQGISKAGNRQVQALMIQLAWLWLRYQPDSKHSPVTQLGREPDRHL